MKQIIVFALFIALLPKVHSQNSEILGAYMFRGNPQLTGVLTNTDAVRGLSGVKFTFNTDGPIRSTPIAFNGAIYFGSADGNMYAVDSNTGKELWRFNTGGAVNSHPAIVNDILYFTSRDGFVYALQVKSKGKELWKFKMQTEVPFDEGYDYYLSSPTIADGVLYIGGGDGNLYALNAKTGKVIWKYNAGSRIRTSPAITNENIVFGTLNGIVYSVKKNDGSLNWKFETSGAGLRFEDAGYDQTSIICSPAVTDKAVYIGGRDGFLYALDLKTGKEIWKVSHGGSWVLAAAVDEEYVYASSGSSAFIQAVDINTGEEKWKFRTMGIVYASPILVEDVLYCSDYAGSLFALNKRTGEKIWSFPMGGRSFSTPIVYKGLVYGAADNGVLFALEGFKPRNEPALKFRKIVYWQGSKSSYEYSWFQEGASLTIRDHFKNAGYELADASQIVRIVNELIESKTPSVIVFADNKFPQRLVEMSSGEALIRKYLNAGGKVVMLASNPLGFQRNPDTGQLTAIDFAEPIEKVFDIKLYDRDWMNVGSVYNSRPTEEGLRWGLRGWWVGASAIAPSQVTTVLATNEHGMATSWLKSYGGSKGTGLLQLSLPVGNRSQLTGDFLAPIQAAVEYGIDW
jgi:eukaryotic-like serine/threonine-protein kinase